MQLNVRDLTKLLNVTESTIPRWIKQRGLPAQQVGGHYHVNRAELLEWATANNVKVALELFNHFEANAETLPRLVEALEAGGIHYQLQDTDKCQALRALVQVLPLPEGMDRELLLRLFFAGSLGFHRHRRAALPFPTSEPDRPERFPTEHHALRVLAPVDFGALDGKPVHVLFPSLSDEPRSLALSCHAYRSPCMTACLGKP